MFFEDSMVALGCFLFCVERSKVFLILYHVVAGPLVPDWDEECSSNEILVVWVAGGAAANTNGGRDTLQKRMQLTGAYDATMGFPGEDITR